MLEISTGWRGGGGGGGGGVDRPSNSQCCLASGGMHTSFSSPWRPLLLTRMFSCSLKRRVRGTVGRASACCKAGPSSILGLAP